MAVKIKDTLGVEQVIPNAKDISNKVNRAISTSLEKLGLAGYSGESISVLLADLEKEVSDRLSKNFAGSGALLVRNLNFSQDSVTREVKVTGQVVDPTTGKISAFDYSFSTLDPESAGQAEKIATLLEEVAKIESLIPEQATSQNQLADKDFVNSSISQMASERVTFDAEGHPFSTKAALTSATVFYSKGKAYIPKVHDYTLVEKDESAPDPFTNGQTRYEYDGTGWVYAYGINDKPLTDAERKALESGITKEALDQINIELDNKYEKPATGIPSDDLSQTVQNSLSKANTALQSYTETDPTVPTWAKALNKPTYTKAEVGLGNVDNTSDLAKPVSTAQKTALDTKVDKEEGKQLSTNDYTDDDKETLTTYLPDLVTNTINRVTALESDVDQKQYKTDSGFKTSSKTVVGAVNETFELLKEKIEESTAGVASVNGQTGIVVLDKSDIGLDQVDNTSDLAKPISSVTQAALDDKVDKSYGKGLSTNDYTTPEKNKLAGIEDGANNYVLPANAVLDSDYVHTDNNYTTIEKNKLAGIESGAQVNAVTTVAGRTGDVSLTKADVGLNYVNNTSDANKPVSTRQQAALDLKVDKVLGKDLSTNDYSNEEKAKVAKVAVNEAAIDALEADLGTVKGKIPEAATSDNQLADKAFVTATVSSNLANRVTYNSAGDPFPSRARLLSATTFYNNGIEYTPKKNDYALVQSDEGASSPFTNGQTRFEYSGTSWVFAYGINDRPFTAEEQAAIDSGITATKIAEMESATAAKFTKPRGGIPKSDLSSAVQNSLTKADTALQSYTETDPTVPAWAKATSKPTYTKAEVGLGNVENTADLDKPVSTATQTALTALENSKVDKVSGKQLSTNDYTTAEKNQLSANTSNITGLSRRVSTVEDKIPSSASATNKLVDLNSLNSAIASNAANRVTYNSAGDSFPTRASLLSATEVYNQGIAYTPKKNDYALVLVDETEDGAQTRWEYDGTAWIFAYTISTKPFTAEEQAALDSGITASLVSTFNEAYHKPGNGIPQSDLSAEVQASLVLADTAARPEDIPTIYEWATQPSKPTYSKSEVGLGNVSNLAPADLPVSTATQTAINTMGDTKVDKVSGKQLSTNDFTDSNKTSLETTLPERISENESEITNIKEWGAGVDDLIPDEATSTNKLADKAFVNSSISQSAANRVTYTASGAGFPTLASLAGATTVYSQGVAYTPKKNDYALVLADEGAPSPFTNGQTRYEYNGTSWVFAYGINDRPFTAAETAALNSGITADKITSMDAATAAKYTKPTTGIPEADLSQDVKDSLALADTAIQEADLPNIPDWALASTKPTYTNSEVGLGNVKNVDTTNAGNITSGILPSGRLSGEPGYYSVNPQVVASSILRSNLGNPTVAEMALVDMQASNKLLLYNPTNLTFESSADGITWSDFAVSTTEVKKLVSASASSRSQIIIKNKDLSQLRITVAGTIHVTLDWLYFYLISYDNLVSVSIEGYRETDGVEQWSTIQSRTNERSGWPGHFWLQHPSLQFSSTLSTTRYSKLRITFHFNWKTTYDIALHSLQWFGGYPAGKRTIYDWNEDGVVTFPSTVRDGTGSTLATTTSLNSHINNTSNPHRVTPVQIGAATAEQGAKADAAYPKQTGGIPKTDLSETVQASLTKADTAYQKNAAGIPESDLTGEISAALEKARESYTKPGNGIPQSDFTPEVQSLLDSIDDKVSQETDPTVPAWAKAATKPSYTKAEVGLGNVDNTADLAKPISTATQTALNNKVDKVSGKGLSTNDYTTADKTQVSTNATNISNAVTRISSAEGKIASIENKIPTAASTENQLADKAFVNSSISQSAANRVTYNASGDAFATREVLQTATTFYNQGVAYTPKKNDYALVLADEGAPSPFTNGQTRLEFDGTSWVYAYGINDRPFTEKEKGALASGITSAIVSDVVTNLPKKYEKPGDGIPKTDLDEEVQTVLDSVSTKLSEETDPTVPSWAKQPRKPSYTKAEVGLDNVDNTSDKDKPISDETGAALALKVDKVTGKGLSSNDYTAAEKTKLAGIATGAQVNVITGIRVNGALLTPTSKVIDLAVPTVPSDIGAQAALVSGTNIKTINGSSILASGNLDLALENEVVKLAGDQSVGGTKTFSGLRVTAKTTIPDITKTTEVATEAQLAQVKEEALTAESSLQAEKLVGEVPSGLTFPTFNQNTTGNAATATRLAAARTLQVDLETTTGTVSFNGTSNVSIPVTGRLPYANLASGAGASAAQARVLGTSKGTTAGNLRLVTLDKADVGLGNVSNLSPASLPVSTATQTALDGKVDKAEGMGLSSNDYTSAEKTKLSNIAAGAQVNTINTIQANGTSLPISNRTVNITRSSLGAASVSDLELKADRTEITNFITKAVSDLDNYYNKTWIDSTVTGLNNSISAIPKFSIEVITSLESVTNPSATVLYLLKPGGTEDKNLYEEYIWVIPSGSSTGSWEKLGQQTLDLSGYVTTTALTAALDNYYTFSETNSAISTAINRIGLVKVATSGLASDLTTDTGHMLVSDEEKDKWNSAKTTADDLVNGGTEARRATKLSTARTINLTGTVTGSGSFDGSDDVSIYTTIKKVDSATTADSLSDTSMVGSNLKPIYFNDGKPVECGIELGTFASQTLPTGAGYLRVDNNGISSVQNIYFGASENSDGLLTAVQFTRLNHLVNQKRFLICPDWYSTPDGLNIASRSTWSTAVDGVRSAIITKSQYWDKTTRYVDDNVPIIPRVRTFYVDDTNNTLTETFDSCTFNYNTGEVTVYSNDGSVCLVLIC